MQLKVYLFLLPLCIAFSCVQSEQDTENVASNGVLVSDSQNSPAKPRKTPLLVIEDVQVLSARKVKDIHSNYFKEYRLSCKDWKPNKATVGAILKDSKIIEGHEYHSNYEMLPCYIIGEVIINCNIKAKYELNAGATAVLFMPDTAYHLGYFGNEHFLIYRASE
jgi:hypothetical protein